MENYLKNLLGSQITGISRVCDLASIEFTTRDGEKINLHVQTFFRFVSDDRILLSSEDMYRCDASFDVSTFEWDVPGKSLYDVTVHKVFDWIGSTIVSDIKKMKTNDLIISFQNGLQLQIFINSVFSEEKYRAFDDANSYEIYS